MNPHDPLCSIHDLVVGDESEPGLAISTAPRATAQRRYADEYGLAFQEVACRRVYVRILTRQEAWEAYGQEEEREKRQDEKGVGWYFAARPCVTTEGYYYDDLDENGLHQPVSAEDWAYIEGVPAEVPWDWDPPEHGYAWERVGRDHPKAVPAWECSEF